MACRSMKRAAATSDYESGVDEVTRAYQITVQLQDLLRQKLPHGNAGSDIAGELSKEILQSLSLALSALNPCKYEMVSFQTNLCSDEKVVSYMRSQPDSSSKRRRTSENSSSLTTVLTSSPYYDGHQWRKYGQKTIRGWQFQRWYYKCTYHIQGCPATKQVQLKNSNDPPMFQVSYNQQHTCKKSFVAPQPLMDDDTKGIKQYLFSSSSPSSSSSSSSTPTQTEPNPNIIGQHKDFSPLGSPMPADLTSNEIELLSELLAPTPDIGLPCSIEDPFTSDGGNGFHDPIFLGSSSEGQEFTYE